MISLNKRQRITIIVGCFLLIAVILFPFWEYSVRRVGWDAHITGKIIPACIFFPPGKGDWEIYKIDHSLLAMEIVVVVLATGALTFAMGERRKA